MNDQRVTSIVKMILNVVKDMGREDENIDLMNIVKDSVLYGKDGLLDSLGLVSLISELEELIEEEFTQELILADERAMSQKFSPFRSVQKLAEYIDKLLLENE